ncbi:MAG: hypothetical protein KBG15_16855 [Kofleriaceae bacterium]|nr:hypothetical protein [Kofleriaceae bacterium]
MTRLAVVFAVLGLAACSKSAGSQDQSTATVKPPANEGAGERIAVPGSTVASPPTMNTGGAGAETAMGKEPPGAGTGPATAGADTSFTLTIDPFTGAAGAAVAGSLKIVPGKGFHVNKDFPVKLTLEAPAGVTLAKAVQEKPDAAQFDDDNLIFNVKATAVTAGSYNIKGKFKFAVCTASTCDPKSVPVDIALAVK